MKIFNSFKKHFLKKVTSIIYPCVTWLYYKMSFYIDPQGNKILSDVRIKYKEHLKKIIEYRQKELFPHESYIPSNIETCTCSGELAIVIQGIIETKDNFTLETVLLYKKLFPGSLIIISTWDNTPEEVLCSFRNEGCTIILNKCFDVCGLGNVNYQICTTFSGIKKAKEIGAKYILKNRSDLRIYKEFAFEYLKTLLQQIPVKDNTIPLKGRIITFPGFSGQLFYTNWLQDFFYFGYTEDLYNLFDIPYDDRDGLAKRSSLYLRDKYDNHYDGGTMCAERVPEVFITTSFLLKYTGLNYTLKESWDFHKKYFLVIDFEDVDALWFKYGIYSMAYEYRGNENYGDFQKGLTKTSSMCIIGEQFKYDTWMEQERFRNVIF